MNPYSAHSSFTNADLLRLLIPVPQKTSHAEYLNLKN